MILKLKFHEIKLSFSKINLFTYNAK